MSVFIDEGVAPHEAKRAWVRCWLGRHWWGRVWNLTAEDLWEQHCLRAGCDKIRREKLWTRK